MYTVKNTSQFKKDLKLMQKQGKDISMLANVVKKLAAGEELDPKFRDHALTGNFLGCRECHIAPDWLLIYEISGEQLYLYLTRTGSHSSLFQK